MLSVATMCKDETIEKGCFFIFVLVLYSKEFSPFEHQISAS